MGRLFVLLLLMPWWAYILASVGVIWLGEKVYVQALEAEAEKAAALAAGMPAAVDLGAFDRARDVHLADEVHVTGWIDPELNYELVKRKNGVPVSTRYMFMMFGADDPSGAPEVRAALMLTAAERDAFLDHIDDFVVGLTDAGDYIFGFNGVATSSVTLSAMAVDAISEQGRAKAAGFVYVEPFFAGREAALAPHGVPDQTRMIFWLVAAGVAAIGVVKRVMSVRAQPSRDVEAANGGLTDEGPDRAGDALDADERFAPAATMAMPERVGADTPLGRLALRRAAAVEVSADAAEKALPRRETRLAFDSDGEFDAPVASSDLLPEVEPAGPVSEPGNPASSDLSFYIRLGLGMLVVGFVAYKPGILNLALPFIGVALFWFGVYVVFQKVRSGARRAAERAA